jgi:predicted nucleic acid-binding Zn ribbon protein
MPIYEYRRPDGTTFEIQQSFSDESLSVDPDTGVPVERVLHAPAVHFKGKGFYNTDYGTRKRQRETAAAAEGSSSSEGSSSKDSSAKDSSSKDGSTSSGGEGSGSAAGEATGSKGAKQSGGGKQSKRATGNGD